MTNTIFCIQNGGISDYTMANPSQIDQEKYLIMSKSPDIYLCSLKQGHIQVKI